jgi:cytochrome b
MTTSSPFTPSARAEPRASTPGRRVTDAPTRMFHWLFALSFVGAYATAESEHFRLLHVTLGYTLGGLLVFRLLYGLVGPRQLRLGALWRRLAGLPAWLQSGLRSGWRAPGQWRQGQHLLMALALASLLLLVLPLTLSGYATFNDWGGHALEEAHEFFGNAFLAVALGHVGLVAAMSLLRRQNLAAPMVTGRTAAPGPDLVKANRGWLAIALLLAVLAFGGWQWQQSPNGLFSATPDARSVRGDDD